MGKAAEAEGYVMGPEKFPLEQNRLGFLPPALELFLDTQNSKCQAREGDKSLKPDTPCILRKGVETNPTQSFIACLADLYGSFDQEQPIPSILEMKEIILEAIDVDNFPLYQNGDLVEMFYKPSTKVNIDDYASSALFQQTDTQDPDQVFMLERIISAFENFRDFMRDPSISIDYEYLWDIVCVANPRLFPKGLNLVILELPSSDMTDNVEIICPPNHYAAKFFDSRKDTLVLIKRSDGRSTFFEPIYVYTEKIGKRNRKTIKIDKVFNQFNKTLLPNLKNALETIKHYMNNNCKALPSLGNVYTFKQSILLETLENELKKIDSKILNYVINYNGKVVGLFVEVVFKKNAAVKARKMRGVLPCFPAGFDFSAASGTPPTKYVTDNSLWREYSHTMLFLKEVHKENKNIPCLPRLKVLEDGMVVGLLTETNQFIKLKSPAENHDDGVETLDGEDYLMVDQGVLTERNRGAQDEERIEYLRKIRLEKAFYGVFRNTARVLLNTFENRKVRAEIIAIVERHETDETAYYDKMEEVIDILERLLEHQVRFVKYTAKKLRELGGDESASAAGITMTSCGSSGCDTPYCEASDDGEKCTFLIPAKNLLTGRDNKLVYFAKLADEFVRYEHIRVFLLEPSKYLAFSDAEYAVNSSEIILIQSLITQEYFDAMVPYTKNTYIQRNVYDTALPQTSIKYSNIIDPGKKSKGAPAAADAACYDPKLAPIVRGFWHPYLGAVGKYRKYNATESCTFQLAEDILAAYGVSLSNVDIRRQLIIEYVRLMNRVGQSALFAMLLNQANKNKKYRIREIMENRLTLEDYIISDNYYLTNLDLLILAKANDIPLVFVAVGALNENIAKALSVVSPEKMVNCVIVRVPATPETIPVYRLLIDNDSKTPVIPMAPSLRELLEKEQTPFQTLDAIIENYQPAEHGKRGEAKEEQKQKRKQKRKLVIQD